MVKATVTKTPSSPMKKQRGVTAGIARGAETESNAVSYGRSDENQDVSQISPHLNAPSAFKHLLNSSLTIRHKRAVCTMAQWLIWVFSRAIPTHVPHAAAKVNYFVAMDAGALSTSLASTLQ